MCETVHIAFALFLLKVFQNSLIVFPAAFVSHFLLDMVPHYKVEMSIKRKFVIEISIDILISTIFILFYFAYAKNLPSTSIILVTCFFAILPDFFLVLDWLWGIKILKPFFLDFHTNIQHEYSWAWIVEMGFLACLLFFLF
jgi:hypothetical protein